MVCRTNNLNAITYISELYILARNCLSKVYARYWNSSLLLHILMNGFFSYDRPYLILKVANALDFLLAEIF